MSCTSMPLSVLCNTSIDQSASNMNVLQTVIARETDPLHSQVVSMTRFNTGENAYNVIPDVVKLGATYRSLTHEGMVRMKKRMYEVGASALQRSQILNRR